MQLTEENIKKAKELKAKLAKTPRKVQIQVPAPGTFCQVSFCSDEASHYMDDRAICNIHYKTFTEIEAEVA